MRTLPRSFFARSSLDVAADLLGTTLRVGPCAGRIVEVEAYCGADDPASHAYRGRTDRNATMFGPPGRLYVYFTYGMHWCANVVTAQEGVAEAVLIRALVPTAGLEEMRARRPAARRDRDLCRGPANLCAALGIDRTFDSEALSGPRVRLEGRHRGAGAPPMASGARVGISRAVERPWRFWVVDEPHVSGPVRARRDGPQPIGPDGPE